MDWLHGTRCEFAPRHFALRSIQLRPAPDNTTRSLREEDMPFRGVGLFVLLGALLRLALDILPYLVDLT